MLFRVSKTQVLRIIGYIAYIEYRGTSNEI